MSEKRRAPLRTCVSCRESSEKKSLLRIVRSANGRVSIDPSGKIPGRGAYLCGSRKCLALAVKANKLGRALRCDVPQSLILELESHVVDERNGNEEKQ